MTNNKQIKESFGVGDLSSPVLSPKLHFDEFCSKLGKDSDIMVISFLVNDRQAAIDLVDFLEKGYPEILDADVSTSEIKLGAYLVFVELLRRTRVIDQIFKIVSDLQAASGLSLKDWRFRYITGDTYYPLTKKMIRKHVPLSPAAYKKVVTEPINEIKELAGIPIQEEFIKDLEILAVQHAAGIK